MANNKRKTRSSVVKSVKHVEPKPMFEANISEKGYTSYFKLKMYKNNKVLCKALNHLYPKKKGFEDKGEYAGLVIEQNILREEEFEEFDDIMCQFATCFLSAEDISYSIIAHEASHLALTNERLLKRYVGGYKNEDAKYGNVPEERLAYCLEAYVSAIIACCKEHHIPIKDE